MMDGIGLNQLFLSPNLVRRVSAGSLFLAMAFWAAPARASIVYSYGEQTVSGIIITGAGLSNGTLTLSSTGASATANGGGVATNNATDAPEAYAGAPAPAPQNDYTKYSAQGGGPQAGDFSRADALLTGGGNLFSSGATLSAVAEAVASGIGLVQGNSSSTDFLSGSFTSTGTSITVSYNFANDIVAIVTSGGSAQSHFGFTISVTDQHGHEIDSAPASLQMSLTSPPNGPEIISSGSGSAILSLAGLTAGDVYTISLNNGATADASLVAATPEPTSVGLLIGGPRFVLRPPTFSTELIGARRRNSPAGRIHRPTPRGLFPARLRGLLRGCCARRP